MKIEVEETFGGLVIWQGADQVFVPSEKVGMIFQSIREGGYLVSDLDNAPACVAPDRRMWVIPGKTETGIGFQAVSLSVEDLESLMGEVSCRIRNYRTGL